jgi:hypothetical protein
MIIKLQWQCINNSYSCRGVTLASATNYCIDWNAWFTSTPLVRIYNLCLSTRIPDEEDGLLRAIKIRSTPSFGAEVKPCALVVRFNGMLNIPAVYDRDTTLAILKNISCQISASLFGVCYNKRALVDESGITRNQMGALSI